MLLQNIQTGSGAHQVSYSMSIRVLSPEAKRQGHEVDHSPPFTAEIKYEWICTSAPPICLQCVDNLILTSALFYRRMHV